MQAMTVPPDAATSADNELLTQILARRRRRLPRMTMALVALLVLALVFVVGAEVQKHYGKTAVTTSGPAGGATAAFARARGSGQPGGFGYHQLRWSIDGANPGYVLYFCKP